LAIPEERAPQFSLPADLFVVPSFPPGGRHFDFFYAVDVWCISLSLEAVLI
jgi:hypothetical protein